MKFQAHGAKPPLVRQAYTVMELVMAGAVLGVMLTAFSTTLSLVRKMEVRYLQDHAAINALDNVVEQLATSPTVSKAELNQLIERELDGIRCPRHTELSAAVHVEQDRVALSVRRPNGQPVASVDVPFSSGVQ